MADQSTKEDETETTTEAAHDSDNQDESQNKGEIGDGLNQSIKTPYKQKYKSTWELDPELKDWLGPSMSDDHAGYCKYCRCNLHAHKKGLLAHAKSAKHHKNLAKYADAPDMLALLPAEPRLFKSKKNGVLTPVVDIGDKPGMLVDEILDRLDKHVPLELAESWDNVGIITKPTQSVKVYHVLLTIDLDERIVEEALKKKVQFIIAYHPPIFAPIKRLNPNSWKDKAILMCVENKITVYSPHTALDAIKGGINDWLVSSFMTNELNKVNPLHYSCTEKKTSCLEVLLSESQETVAEVFKDVHDVTMTDYGNASTDVKVSCDSKTLPEVLEALTQKNFAQLSCRVTKLDKIPIPGVGMGRLVTFDTSLPLYEVVQRTKTHLDLTYIRLALSPKHTRDYKVKSLAVCAGSGSSVLKGCFADVWITGEMSHHEVLEAINNGVTVILCEHSNTERGFLRDWSQQLRSSVFEDQVMVSVSELDRDPLRIV